VSEFENLSDSDELEDHDDRDDVILSNIKVTNEERSDDEGDSSSNENDTAFIHDEDSQFQ
jgi:hypothetical protein